MARITKEEANRIIEILSRVIDRKISERFGEHPKINGVEFEKRYMKVGYGGDRFVDHKLFRLYLKLVSPLMAVNDGEDGNVLVFKDGESRWVDPEEMGMRMKVEFPEELPETGAPFTLYFIPAEDPSSGNDYDEYLYIDDKWERVGSLDLSDYYTKSEVDAEMQKISRIYDRNARGGALIRNLDGTIFAESTDSGLAQINYSHQGYTVPAIQITDEEFFVKDTDSQVRIAVNGDGVRLKGAPNDLDGGIPEVTLNKDGQGGVRIKGGSDVNLILTPTEVKINAHGNGLGYAFDAQDPMSDQTFKIDLNGDTVVKVQNEVSENGAVTREENISVKTPNTRQNVVQSNGRRLILYHPNGEQLVHSNPTALDKNGNPTNTPRLVVKNADGNSLFFEEKVQYHQGQQEITERRITLQNDSADVLYARRENDEQGNLVSADTTLCVDRNDVLYASAEFNANGENHYAVLGDGGNSLIESSREENSNAGSTKNEIIVYAAGDHEVLRGGRYQDINSGDVRYETKLMTNGCDTVYGVISEPQQGAIQYEVQVNNPNGDEVLMARRVENAHAEFNLLVSNSGQGELLSGYTDPDDDERNMSLMNHGYGVVSAQRNNVRDWLTISHEGRDVLYAEYHVDNIGGIGHDNASVRLSDGNSDFFYANSCHQGNTDIVMAEMEVEGNTIVKGEHLVQDNEYRISVENNANYVVLEHRTEYYGMPTQCSTLKLINEEDEVLESTYEHYSGTPVHTVTLSNKTTAKPLGDDELLKLNGWTLADLTHGLRRTKYSTQAVDSATDAVFDFEECTTLITTITTTATGVHSNGLDNLPNIPYDGYSKECRLIIINGNQTDAFTADVLPQVGGQNYMIQPGEAAEMLITVFRQGSMIRVLKAEPRRMVF